MPVKGATKSTTKQLHCLIMLCERHNNYGFKKQVTSCGFQNLCLHEQGGLLWDALSVHFPGADKILKGAVPALIRGFWHMVPTCIRGPHEDSYR